VDRWAKFLGQFRDQAILDFGCGPGFALKAGKDLGLNITGLDIKGDPVYADLHKLLDVKPMFYDGRTLPFQSKQFNIVLFHWSFVFDLTKDKTENRHNAIGLKMSEQDIDERVKMLSDVTFDGGYWWISPQQHFVIAKQHKPKRINLKYFTL
jgi:SAM-dependent methyltransferase